MQYTVSHGLLKRESNCDLSKRFVFTKRFNDVSKIFIINSIQHTISLTFPSYLPALPRTSGSLYVYSIAVNVLLYPRGFSLDDPGINTKLVPSRLRTKNGMPYLELCKKCFRLSMTQKKQLQDNPVSESNIYKLCSDNYSGN